MPNMVKKTTDSGCNGPMNDSFNVPHAQYHANTIAINGFNRTDDPQGDFAKAKKAVGTASPVSKRVAPTMPVVTSTWRAKLWAVQFFDAYHMYDSPVAEVTK